jgi:hypothetical protein
MQGLVGVGRLNDSKPGVAEIIRHRKADQNLVLDQEYPKIR